MFESPQTMSEYQPEDVEQVASVQEEEMPSEEFVFENLTLWQALELLLFRPVRAGHELWRVIAGADDKKIDEPIPSEAWIEEDHAVSDSIGIEEPVYRFEQVIQTEETFLGRAFGVNREQIAIAGLLLFAIWFALIGASTLRDAALDPAMKANNDTGGSTFWFMLALFTYFTVVAIDIVPWVSRRFRQETVDESVVETESAIPEIVEPSKSFDIFAWFERHAMRLFLVPVALLLAWLAYDRNVSTNLEGDITGIVFTKSGFAIWALAIAIWYIIFTTDLNRLYVRLAIQRERFGEVIRWRVPRFQWGWATISLLIIMGVGGYFRLHDLDRIPPEMTSDHIEKLINAVEVKNGFYAVFFANNGGREAFQMYVVSAIAEWGGVGFNFRALKYATILEGMLTIFLSFWVAKEVIGRDTEERRRLGTWVGLVMAALMAVSAWHTMLSRLGLRIVLTPLTVLLMLFFLVRAVRYNRRADFANLGLVLGFGTYFYQANRMLPVMVVLAVVLAIVFQSKGRLPVIGSYSVNLVFTGFLAIVIYLPMHHYSQEFPREFWNRTYGRTFGDRTFDCINPETNDLDFCPPSISEMLELLSERTYGRNADLTGYEAIEKNYKDALLSYMWVGDPQWITNGGGYPALDAWTAALYILGIAVWIGFAIKYRDVALLIVPISVLILVLPSALAIAPYLNENPSYTRISGTLPAVFMIAALPLGLLVLQIVKAGQSRRFYYGVAGLVVAFYVYKAAPTNYDAYFETYYEGYANAWRPYSQIAAPLKEFAEGRGSFGNAFYINTAHWLDHRVLGSVAGDLSWPNGLLQASDVYLAMRVNQNTSYAYDPTKPLLFYVHTEDSESIEFLERNFPDGQLREIVIPTDVNFYVYEAPSGWGWLATRLATETARMGCIINCLPGPR